MNSLFSEQISRIARRAMISGATFLSPLLLLNLGHQSPALAGRSNQYFGSACNGTEETLYLTIGVRPTTCGRRGCTKQYVPIVTEGWWIISPRSCESFYIDTAYKNKYARGERFVSAYTASHRWEGSHNLCVRNSAFTMQGERGYEDCYQSNGYQRGFRKISRNLHVSFQPRNGRTYGAPEYQFLLAN
nr:DUF1036 domain-containing protein [Adonisia turfae]